jgi:hypothetical protein
MINTHHPECFRGKCVCSLGSIASTVGSYEVSYSAPAAPLIVTDKIEVLLEAILEELKIIRMNI